MRERERQSEQKELQTKTGCPPCAALISPDRGDFCGKISGEDIRRPAKGEREQRIIRRKKIKVLILY